MKRARPFLLLCAALPAAAPIAVERPAPSSAATSLPSATPTPRRYVPHYASRADALDAAAAGASDPAERARLQRKAVATRLDAAQMEIAGAQAREQRLGAALLAQRARLAAGQGGVLQLVGALVGLARRPAILAIAQPGSIDDLVHVEAALSAGLPVVRRRTAAIRAELATTRALQASAGAAARALAAGQARLFEASETLGALAPDASDAAALDAREEARDAAAAVAEIGGGQALLAELAALPGPPIPRAIGRGPGVYRLPVAGALRTGLGEVSAEGVRARGVTLAVAPGARVVAPAGGRVAYARPFRDFGGIVIVDHGAGWTTLVTGMGDLRVAQGDRIAAGSPLGHAARPTGGAREAVVTVELRRRGRPVDLTQLLR